MRGVCRCASVYSVARRASVYVCVGMGGIENFILQYVVEKITVFLYFLPNSLALPAPSPD